MEFPTTDGPDTTLMVFYGVLHQRSYNIGNSIRVSGEGGGGAALPNISQVAPRQRQAFAQISSHPITLRMMSVSRDTGSFRTNYSVYLHFFARPRQYSSGRICISDLLFWGCAGSRSFL